MGYYSLMLEKRYREFCEVYREKGHLCKENPAEYGDLQPGSQVRALVPATFLIAVKRSEKGDLEGCRQALKETRGLYERDQIAVVPCEYFLAESWLTELERQKTDSDSREA